MLRILFHRAINVIETVYSYRLYHFFPPKKGHQFVSVAKEAPLWIESVSCSFEIFKALRANKSLVCAKNKGD